MQRFAMDKLLKWKESKYRKPLILKGVRQVGKTWLLKEFGKLYYDNIAYFNFDENIEYRQFFETTKDISRILQNLTLASGQKITPQKTLIIFDEVQDCPNVINCLKYFCENGSEYHIACAGSLLGISLAKPSSFPVGKVDFLDIKPMTFSEFLLANGDENLVEYLDSITDISPVPDAFFNPLYEKLKMYYITGGMPEPVLMWTEERDVEAMQAALSNIIGAYERDFAKHPSLSEFPKISMIWKSIPSQLSRENKKFIYKAVKEGARAREYEDALQWLADANLVSKIYRSTAPGLPIAACDDLSAFKIYLCDVGLLRRLAQLNPSAFAEGSRIFTEFKGALSENYVLQSLQTQFEVTPRYWSQANPPYDVDFLIQHENDILPVEVKSETNLEGKSLRKYKELYSDDTKLRVRFSLANLKLDNDVLNIPLFMADKAEKLIGIVLNSLPQ
ncbi:MAG: ATP-binding protein [Oscillospiraceae bacterium]